MGYSEDTLMYIGTPQTNMNLANIIRGTNTVFFMLPTGEAAGVSPHCDPPGITCYQTEFVSPCFWGNGGPPADEGSSDMRCEHGNICIKITSCKCLIKKKEKKTTLEPRLHGAAGSMEMKSLHRACNAVLRYLVVLIN